MGILSDIVSGITGIKAAKRAARARQGAANLAIEAQKQARDQSIADIQNFATAGKESVTELKTGLSELQDLVANPQTQLAFIQNNPFFNSIAARTENALLNSQAAQGKAASGGTVETLQNALLLLGTDLVNQNITQRQNVNDQLQNLVNAGLTATNAQSNIRTGAASNISNLQTQIGNAQATGIIGTQNVRQKALHNTENNLFNATKFAVNGGVNL